MPVPHPSPSPNQSSPDEALLLRLDEAARVLTVSRATLERMVSRGEIVPVRLGKLLRFRRETLEAYVIQKEQDEVVDLSLLRT